VGGGGVRGARNSDAVRQGRWRQSAVDLRNARRAVARVSSRRRAATPDLIWMYLAGWCARLVEHDPVGHAPQRRPHARRLFRAIYRPIGDTWLWNRAPVKIRLLGGGGSEHALAWAAGKFGHDRAVVPSNAGNRGPQPKSPVRLLVRSAPAFVEFLPVGGRTG
jgi:hypothetical protein